MSVSDVLIVMLRQPRMDEPSERRSDPFWEFGSFGCTGCHRRNLLNPRRASELEGKRLAFAQGGVGEVRLVHLTGPVSVIYHSHTCELRWKDTEMPLRYAEAPIIIDNTGRSDFGQLLTELKDVSRTTHVGCFSSKFRSRRTPIREELALQITRVFSRVKAEGLLTAREYEQALPYPPPIIDRDRAQTYNELLRVA